MHSALDPGERLSVADGLVAGVVAGGANLAAFFDRLPLLLKGDERLLLMSPMPLWRVIQTHMLDDAGRSKSRARIRALYGPVLADLRKRGVVSDEDRLTQTALVNVLAMDGRDTTLRAELTGGAIQFLGFGGDRQLHRAELEVNLVNTALRVAARDAAPQFAVDLVDRLPELDDPVLRYAFLGAIGVASDPTLAQRLALDESIRGDDLLNLLESMFTTDQAEPSWVWLAANIDALIGKTPTFERDLLIQVTGRYCAVERADAVAALFEPRLQLIDGGRRVLDQTLERIGLCVALRNSYERQARELFN
jgi:alanyl aminopeptidase